MSGGPWRFPGHFLASPANPAIPANPANPANPAKPGQPQSTWSRKSNVFIRQEMFTIIVMTVIVYIMLRSLFDSSLAQVTATLEIHLPPFQLQNELHLLFFGL